MVRASSGSDFGQGSLSFGLRRTEICRQMRLGGDANWERGLMDLNRNLYGVTSKAEEVFNPVIERRTRAEKLRLTLALLERWKFFFNLPTLLQQSVRKGKIDVAVRDYQKGYYLMKTTIGFKEAPRDSKSGQSLSDEQRKGPVYAVIVFYLSDFASSLQFSSVSGQKSKTWQPISEMCCSTGWKTI